MEKPGEILQIGIYGTNVDGSLAIPTAMTKIAIISAGADPSGDESTDPTLPVWEQINKAAVKTVNGTAPDENGNVETVPCITASGAPTTATAGAVGCLYMDTATGDLYKCTAVSSGVYTWARLVPLNTLTTLNFTYQNSVIESDDYSNGVSLYQYVIAGVNGGFNKLLVARLTNMENGNVSIMPFSHYDKQFGYIYFAADLGDVIQRICVSSDGEITLE